jgi:hypothetical protein
MNYAIACDIVKQYLKVLEKNPDIKKPKADLEAEEFLGDDFVEEIIGDTHTLVEHHGDQGYLLAFPVTFTEDQIREVIK